MEKLTQMEKVSLGGAILFGMCCLLELVMTIGSYAEARKNGNRSSPAPVTMFSVEGPGVSWTAEKTNTVVRWPKPSDIR